MKDVTLLLKRQEAQEQIQVCRDILAFIRVRDAGRFLHNVEYLLNDEIRLAEERMVRYQKHLENPQEA